MTVGYVIVGAGVFGLTTALSLAHREPEREIVVVDRLEPPVPDGASVDTSRIVRADYADPLYARLAKTAQVSWRSDAELRAIYHECGLLLNTYDDGRGYLDASLENVRALGLAHEILDGPEILRRIRGREDSETETADTHLRGYINTESGFADSRKGIEILYRRARALKNVSFVFEPVTGLLYGDESRSRVLGVSLESGRRLEAERTILATGAWQLPDVALPTIAAGQVLAFIDLTEAEVERYRDMPIHINFATGWFCIPPYEGRLKVARHAEGYTNTKKLVDPDSGESRTLSIPRTSVTHKDQEIPAEGERALREGLRIYLPELADRAFSKTRVCWYTDTPRADFLIDWYPGRENLFVATGGSGHGYKFLPILGDLITSVLDGTIEEDIRAKWSFQSAHAALEVGSTGDGSRGRGGRLEWESIALE